MTTSSSRADSGFAYSRSFFENLVDTALAHAKKLGPPTPAPRPPKAAA
jgi:PmbA protein